MKAVVYKGPKNVEIEEVENPKIERPTDVLVRVTTSAICGSDLHMYDGETIMESGRIFGHEPMGIVEAVGDAVELTKPGDRVVIPFNVACGFCLNCIQGMTNACLTMNPEQPGAAYGYAGMGPYAGAQAEYVRVPFGDWACLKLPGEPGDQFEDDFMMLADIFPTGYYGAELAHVGPGKAVAVFGAGPVGLLAAYSSILKGAAEVYVVDNSDERLKRAESIGAIPVNFEEGDPAEKIMELRQQNKNLTESLRPGEEKTLGVDCAIDAVGYQASSRKHPEREKRNQVLMDIANIINAGGHLGIVGVYPQQNPAGETEDEQQGNMMFPIGKFFENGITIGMGQTPVKQLHVHLRNLIFDGKAKPGFIVSDRIPIEEAPQAYNQFDRRDDVVKPVIRFEGAWSK
ncbi:glutathione-independent formaldehyde dehydrogenase [Methanobacterium sp. ACI-7]|uniref:glutathione-independent formaldehyde dehydrogenase n=1 Tax=unclassified Methanobacterium TaxID=2627676 RepID=UPI0039C3D163